MKLDNIKRVFCENTGGGTMVDFIELNDGRILGINEDFVVLYSSLDEFYDCTSESFACQQQNNPGSGERAPILESQVPDLFLDYKDFTYEVPIEIQKGGSFFN